MKYEHQKG